MQKILSIVLVFLLSFSLLTSCKDNKVSEQLEKVEKKVDQVTDDTARTVSKKIKTPLQKARDAAAAGEDRLEEIGDAVAGK